MNFHPKEFFCGCGCGLNFKDINQDAFNALQEAREVSEYPYIINSSIRCKQHNKAVGGSINSSHLKGLAFDIKYYGSKQRYGILKSLLTTFNRIGISRFFLHVDFDTSKPQNVIWLYK